MIQLKAGIKTGFRSFSKARLFILINLFSWILMTAIPVQHAKMTMLLIFALTGWGMGVLPQPVVSLLIIALIPLLGLGSFEDSLIGYAQPFIWLLVSTFILAAALENTGLGRRISIGLLLQAKGKANLSVLLVLLSVVVLGFLIPTAAGRSAMIMPVCLGIIQVMGSGEFGKSFSKNIMLGVAFTSSFIQWGIITGSSSSVYAVSALETMIGYKWSYANWILCNFPIMAVLILCLWFILGRKYPISPTEMSGSYEYIQTELAAMGKMGRKEWNILWIGLFTLTGWIAEPLHGLSVSLIALLAAVFSCLPAIGVQTWKDASKHISWDVIILFGAGYALADALQRNETAVWMAAGITDVLPQPNPFEAALLMLLIILVSRLGYANMLAITAAFLPVTVNLAQFWSINPVWLTQIVIIACSFGYFMPVQSPSNLITFSYGYYSEKELAQAGLYVSILVIALVLFSALFYWPLVGLAP